MQSKTFPCMGTNVEILIGELLSQTESNIDQALQLAQGRMRSLESLLSRFREDSDVSRMNSGMGQWIDVSSDTIQILLLARDAFTRTQGFFNPFMGEVIENLGYHVTFEDIGKEAGFTLSVAAPYVPLIEAPLEIDSDTSRARIEPGYKIDLGGIAKGWIVEQAANELVKCGMGHFVCNAGGDLVCKSFHDGDPWVIGITDPFDPLKMIANLDVCNTSVATSGTYRRKWSFEGRAVHHIMDPFSGQPVQTDIVSCTVVHPSLTEAEILAKVTLILGTDQGISWLENQSADGWIVVTNTGEVKYSCNL